MTHAKELVDQIPAKLFPLQPGVEGLVELPSWDRSRIQLKLRAASLVEGASAHPSCLANLLASSEMKRFASGSDSRWPVLSIALQNRFKAVSLDCVGMVEESGCKGRPQH